MPLKLTRRRTLARQPSCLVLCGSICQCRWRLKAPRTLAADPLAGPREDRPDRGYSARSCKLHP